ncbi:MAG: PEP-CTERM sorting domain-containing protein [Phycisphaeraceae bacterium]|nr:MAG: PEP-CTERM sorting domain-containing protein [Phycisphaeraceae bacterium]
MVARFTLAAAIALPAVMAATAGAGVTYLDATDGVGGNTTYSDGSVFTAVDDSTAADNMWNQRDFANNASIYSTNESSENGARLMTTVSGLSAGQEYDVYAYFWGASGQLWRGRAALVDNAAGDIQGYNTSHFSSSSFLPMDRMTDDAPGDASLQTNLHLTYDAGGFENSGYFDNAVLIHQSDRYMAQVTLGTAIADANGEIHVYIDDLANTSNGNRTWYDGVGTALVPAPGAILLLGAGGLFATRRRS